MDHQIKRGRPPLSTLMKKNKSINSKLKFFCTRCDRGFPRKKSLTVHMRIHTGEKPYACTYPACKKTFRQSGQLRTHEKLHTGEKPFACPVEGCGKRFLHPNRQCTKHRERKLIRDGNERVLHLDDLSDDEKNWLQRYEADKENQRIRKEPEIDEEAAAYALLMLGNWNTKREQMSNGSI